MNCKKLVKIYYNFFLLLILISCSQSEVKNNSDIGFYSSGVEQFFLPELPQWANFSEKGECFKEQSIAYLDFKKLKLIHDLTYPQMIYLQTDFNFKRIDYFSQTSEKFLKPIEEMAMFSNSLEMVKSNILPVKIFKSKKYNLIWLEDFVKSNDLSSLEKLLEDDKYLNDPTLLFSSCKTRWELSKLLNELFGSELNLLLIGSDFLVPYNLEINSSPGLRLDLKSLLGKDVEIKSEKNFNLELSF